MQETSCRLIDPVFLFSPISENIKDMLARKIWNGESQPKASTNRKHAFDLVLIQ